MKKVFLYQVLDPDGEELGLVRSTLDGSVVGSFMKDRVAEGEGDLDTLCEELQSLFPEDVVERAYIDGTINL